MVGRKVRARITDVGAAKTAARACRATTDAGKGGTRKTGPTAFERAVDKVIRAIPEGQTLSYSGVALRAGKPRGARAVVRALRRLHGVPWWRVIRADGRMAAEVAAEQAPRLRAEGVQVEGRRVKRPSARC